jgi:hypothetical protein
LLAASLLTACTFSLSGGIFGVITALTLAGLLFGVGATQSGCDDRVTACLSIDIDAGPCLSPPMSDGGADGQADVGPCLTAPMEDGGNLDVGPCLEPLPPDSGLDMGPCLSPLPPDSGGDEDLGVCLSIAPPDAGNTTLEFGPCLSMIPPDGGNTKLELGPCLSQPPFDPGQCLDVKPGSQAAEQSTPSAEELADRSRQRAEAIRRLGHRLPDDVLARLTGKNKVS